MRDIFSLFRHPVVIIVRLARPGGLRSVLAESVLMRHQVLILNRGRKRLTTFGLRSHHRRFVHCTDACGACFAVGYRLEALDSTAFSQNADFQQKYPTAIFAQTSPSAGPKGLTKELIDAVVEMKRRNRTWVRSALPSRSPWHSALTSTKMGSAGFWQYISLRKLDRAVRLGLSFIGHAKDSLWSLDLFRCESAILRTYWVLVVMDQFTRRIVGVAGHRGIVDGTALCQMFNRFTPRHCRSI